MFRNATPPRREPNSDDFLNELVSRDFSSPSIPSQTPHRLNNALRLPPINSPFNNPPVRLGPNYRRVTPGLRIPPVSRQEAPTAQTGENSESESSNSDLPSMSSHARSGRAKRSSARTTELALPTLSSPASQSRRRRGSVISSSGVKRKREESEDLFGVDLEVVDLVDKEEVPEEVCSKNKPKNYVKLGSFQCVICMDDVTDLTVTYCGHLFCAECLHNALNVDATKRVCPICRQKIDNKPSNGKFTAKAKGYFPLELKLTTKRNLRRNNS
ncbi:hypothetical protein QBC35DRAFT_261257 [Podospora australis]|uniref:RING-type domain-containing protein n=1 Tax=Podospora australis TaxID=1536484 RepID=A0AAN6X135_9PEZI|nr:hypothetical protein QBC35DRAFT_261257 [Podospora australis]